MNLFHMKSANASLVNKLVDKLSKINNKRAEVEAGDGVVIAHDLIEEYNWIL